MLVLNLRLGFYHVFTCYARNFKERKMLPTIAVFCCTNPKKFRVGKLCTLSQNSCSLKNKTEKQVSKVVTLNNPH